MIYEVISHLTPWENYTRSKLPHNDLWRHLLLKTSKHQSKQEKENNWSHTRQSVPGDLITSVAMVTSIAFSKHRSKVSRVKVCVCVCWSDNYLGNETFELIYKPKVPVVRQYLKSLISRSFEIFTQYLWLEWQGKCMMTSALVSQGLEITPSLKYTFLGHRYFHVIIKHTPARPQGMIVWT